MILCDGEDSRLWASAKYAGQRSAGRASERAYSGAGLQSKAWAEQGGVAAEVTEETAEKETWEKQAV